MSDDQPKFKYHAAIQIGLLPNGQVEVKLVAPKNVPARADLWEQMLNEAFSVCKNYREESEPESSIITPETKIVVPD